jgi:hypothetical protein
VALICHCWSTPSGLATPFYGVDVSPRMLEQGFQREGRAQPTSYERESIDSSD